jgi:hypothetical protein
MAKDSVAPGQIWRADDTGIHYLVTRTYAELFDEFAVLRRAESGTATDTLRIKIKKNDPRGPLPGFTQEAGEFRTS